MSTEDHLHPPLLTSVAVVCRHFPLLAQISRQIEAFVDVSTEFSLEEVGGKSLRLVQRVFTRLGWDADEVAWGLCEAASEGQLQVIQWLCVKGEELGGVKTSHLINNKDAGTSSLLFQAAGGGHVDVVQWLVQNGADVNEKDQVGRTALHLTAVHGRQKVMQWLVQNGVSVHCKGDNGETPLHEAASVGRTAEMKWLVESGARVDEKDLDGRTALHRAAEEGYLSVVQWLVQNSTCVNEKNEAGHTPFHVAVVGGKLPVVQWLADNGAGVDDKDNEGRTALHLAATTWFESVPLVKFLVDKGLQAFTGDKWAHSALYYTLLNRHFAVAELFLNECLHKEHPLPNTLQNDLFVAASTDQTKIIQHLVEKLGVNVCQVNEHGRTALHEAAVGGAVSAVNLLLELGAVAGIQDDFGATPVIEACRHGRCDALHRLLAAGASVNDCNFAGRSPLHFAVEVENEDLVSVLMEHGANVNCIDKLGWTPLHCAAAAGRLLAVKELVANGAKLNVDTFSSKTPLSLAVERGHSEVSRFLTNSTPEAVQVSTVPTGEDPVDFLEYLIDPKDVHFQSGDVQAEGSWLGSPIELKLKPSWRSTNFIEELHRWSGLNHPHVVKLYGVYRGNGVGDPFFVYERATKGSILKYFREQGKNAVPQAELWSKLYQAAMGLQYMHDRNIIHGDLSCFSIVLASNGVAKLRNFGNDGPGDYRYRQGWRAPEVMSGFPLSFQSDIFDFGIAIVQAVKNVWNPWGLKGAALRDAILSGMLPDKPDHMSKAQWHLIERMCCYNPLDRISASAVVRELEVFAQEFDLPEMEGEELESWSDLGVVELFMSVSDEDDEPTVSSILAEIDEMCGQSTTTDAMNRDVYNRLLDVFKQLEVSTDIPVTGLVQQFICILKFFYFRLKSTNSVGSAQAARFAMSRQGADNSFSVHGDLDLFMEAAKLSTSSQVHNWRAQWETKRLKQKNDMLTKLEDLPALMEDVGSENEREEALTYLRFELSKHPTSYTTSKATEFTQAKSIVTSLSVSRNASWFIPAYEVELDKFDEFSRGAFGKVYHGKWKRSRVVVKKVKLRSEEERAAFLNEVEIWYKLFHPHVVQMFGACHIQRPFFVCEYAGRGQLDHYLRKHPTELWQKLHEAALGLRYLHVKRIVHGDLKCNNILIGNDGYAKLTDFGLSTLVSNSSEENEEPEAELESKGEHTIGAIRWKAPEILCGEKATFESDVYSFGMCILEAVSGKYPWGVTIPDAAVKIHVVKRKKIPMCPANCSENAYRLVERMCQYVPSERIGMAEVVEELEMLH